jgi:Putative helicase
VNVSRDSRLKASRRDAFNHYDYRPSSGRSHWGGQPGGVMSPQWGGVKALPSVEDITERVLYWLSLDMQVRALAERLLGRFAKTVGDLPASADHHHSGPGGLYQHSLEVALKTLEEFEGNIIMERRPDGSVDSFRSSRNRPRWQYAAFIAALCHDLGKLFDLEVRGKGETWCPIHEPYCDFGRRTKAPLASWRPDREHGTHAQFSPVLLDEVMSCENYAYLGRPRFKHLVSCLAEGHSKAAASLLSQMVSRGDQASVEAAQPAISGQPESKVGLLLSTFQELITSGEMGVNSAGAQVYVEGGKAAVVVPIAISLARDRLKPRQIVFAGSECRPNRVSCRTALIFPAEKVVPKHIVPTLLVSRAGNGQSDSAARRPLEQSTSRAS